VRRHEKGGGEARLDGADRRRREEATKDERRTTPAETSWRTNAAPPRSLTCDRLLTRLRRPRILPDSCFRD
jgi:hypothetical protein